MSQKAKVKNVKTKESKKIKTNSRQTLIIPISKMAGNKEFT